MAEPAKKQSATFRRGLDADLTTAARHHSAVNVADSDRVLSKVDDFNLDLTQRQDPAEIGYSQSWRVWSPEME